MIRLIDLPEMIVRDVAALRGNQNGDKMRVSATELDRIVTDRIAEVTWKPPRPGDDLSYYLGPTAKRATQEQCDELDRMFEAAKAEIASR